MSQSSESTETSGAATLPFQAEVQQVLSLVINSLYANQEVFLRELISNASDAIDKLRFRALTDPSAQTVEGTPSIRIIPNEDARTLTLEDDGVGMSHDELIENLGTIAHSGSRKFLEAVKAKGQGDSVNLIGQFGVGFYSAWLVADRVEVISRAAGSDAAWCFTSDAREEFSIEPAERAHHGTTVVLHLRDDQQEFTDRYRLRAKRGFCVAHRLAEQLDDCVGVSSPRDQSEPAMKHRSASVNNARERLGTTEIDADDAVIGHGSSPY